MTLHGIDISHWQSGLQLAKTDAQFAIMKATDGTSYVDATCNGFVNQAKAAGLLWGVYHFWQGSPTAEADHFVDSVAGYVGHGLLVLDFEGAHATSATAAKTWLDRVYARTGVRPLIYMSQSVTRQFDWSAVARDYALWVARYGSSSYGDTGAWKSPVMWQYTDAHPTGGMKVDGDYFYGTADTWRAFATGDATHATDTDEPDDKGDDDMPEETSAGYTADTSTPADGQWRGLKINDDSGDSDYTLLAGPALATGTLSVQVQGKKGIQVLVRSVHSDVKAGADSKIAYTGFPAETFTADGTTQIVLPFTERIHAPAAGWSRKLRFQIKASGGGTLKIVDARARALHWDQ